MDPRNNADGPFGSGAAAGGVKTVASLASAVLAHGVAVLQTWALGRCARATLFLMRHGSVYLSMGAAKEFDDARRRLQGLVGELPITLIDRVRLAWGFWKIRARKRRSGETSLSLPWKQRSRMALSSAAWKLKWWWQERMQEARAGEQTE